MNKLFKSIADKWNKLFRGYYVVGEPKSLGSATWTRHHIYRKRFGKKPKYLGYRLSLDNAIRIAYQDANGNCHIKILGSKQ